MSGHHINEDDLHITEISAWTQLWNSNYSYLILLVTNAIPYTESHTFYRVHSTARFQLFLQEHIQIYGT